MNGVLASKVPIFSLPRLLKSVSQYNVNVSHRLRKPSFSAKDPYHDTFPLKYIFVQGHLNKSLSRRCFTKMLIIINPATVTVHV